MEDITGRYTKSLILTMLALLMLAIYTLKIDILSGFTGIAIVLLSIILAIAGFGEISFGNTNKSYGISIIGAGILLLSLYTLYQILMVKPFYEAGLMPTVITWFSLPVIGAVLLTIGMAIVTYKMVFQSNIGVSDLWKNL